METPLTCQLCSFVSTSNEQLTQHYVRFHRHEPNFRVKCSYCPYTANNWKTFQMHMYRNHKTTPTAGPSQNADENNQENVACPEQEDFMDTFNDDGIVEEPFPNETSLLKTVAAFLMKLEAKHRLSEVALNAIANEISILVDDIQEKTKLEIFRKVFPDQDIPELNIPKPSVFITISLCTAKQRAVFYGKHFGPVEPEPIQIGEKQVLKKGTITSIPINGYFVHFLPSLTALLKMPEVKFWIKNNHQSNDVVLKDWCDGSYFKDFAAKNHENCPIIQVLLNTDDIETTNPIGMHTKIHKMTVISYEIANIPPQFRSADHTKQLIAIANSSVVKKSGLQDILNNFIEGMNQLEQGFETGIPGIGKVRGILLGTPSDTPAANVIWGFKEGVGFAKQCCRTCDGSRPDVFQVFDAEHFPLRDTNEHIHRCNNLDEMSPENRTKWSKEYGINKTSELLKIKDVSIHIAVHDPMHVLLEGVVLLELRELLLSFIFTDKLFTLEWFNSEILMYPYSYLQSSSKPTAFEAQNLKSKKKLTMSAASVLVLLEILPFILNKKAPNDNEKLKCFLLLIKIVHFSISPYATEDTAQKLSLLVTKHHEVFAEQYPDVSLTPKFHYLVHFAKQLLMFGPLRHQWCMRWEAHFNVLKRKKWGSFKNIAYSMAKFHQLWSNWHQTTSSGEPNSNFLYAGDQYSFCPKSCGVDNAREIKEVIVHGHRYQVGCVVLNSEILKETPDFSIVQKIIQENDRIVFEVFDTISVYVDELNAYDLKLGPAKRIFQDELQNPWPLAAINHNNNVYTIHKYCVTLQNTVLQN